VTFSLKFTKIVEVQLISMAILSSILMGVRISMYLFQKAALRILNDYIYSDFPLKFSKFVEVRLFTQKFGKLILERKRSADDVKSEKVF